MRKTVVVACLSVLTLVGCGTSEPGPDEKRQAACEVFESMTPGSLELHEAVDVLSDGGATSTERQSALQLSLDQQSAKKRTDPYDCERDRDLFDRNFGPFE